MQGRAASACSCAACDTPRCALRNTDTCACAHIDRLAHTLHIDRGVIHAIIHNTDYHIDDRTYDTLTQTKHSRRVDKTDENTNTNDDTDIEELSVAEQHRDDRKWTSAAKLSAQVMNLPYVQLEKSLANKTNNTVQKRRLSPFDLFQRLKEVYKACTCKICECVIGGAGNERSCACKPCDCIDCTNMKNRFPTSNDKRKHPGPGCPCVKCSRASCKGINPDKAEKSACDCHRKKRREASSERLGTVVVAPVGGGVRASGCECGECVCPECVQGPVRTRDMGTGVTRHQRCACDACANELCAPDDSDLCWCARHTPLTSKPVLDTQREYDIRSATLTRHTCAMYLTVHNTRHNNNNISTNACKCTPCECLICNNSDNEGILSTVLERASNHAATCNCHICKCRDYKNVYENENKKLRCDVGGRDPNPDTLTNDPKHVNKYYINDKYSDCLPECHEGSLPKSHRSESKTNRNNKEVSGCKEFGVVDQDSDLQPQDYFLCDSGSSFSLKRSKDCFRIADNNEFNKLNGSKCPKYIKNVSDAVSVSATSTTATNDTSPTNNSPLKRNNDDTCDDKHNGYLTHNNKHRIQRIDSIENRKAKNPITNKDCLCNRKQKEHLNEDCRRVHNTIIKARLFSKQLVKLLDIYENANKRFPNTQKTGTSTFSILEDLKEEDNDTESYTRAVHESLEGTGTDVTSVPSLASDHSDNKYCPETEHKHDITAVRGRGDDRTDNTHITNIRNLAIKQFCDLMANNKDILNTIAEERSADISKHSSRHSENKRKRSTRTNTKTHNRTIYRRSILISKKIKINPSKWIEKKEASILTETMPVETVNKNYTSGVNEHVQTSDEHGGGRAHKSITAIEDAVTARDYCAIQEPPTRDYSVLNKYCDLKVEYPVKRSILPRFSALECEVKEAVRCIARHPATFAHNIRNTVKQENKALTNLHTEVKKLLELPMLQPFTSGWSKNTTSEEVPSYEQKGTTPSIHSVEKQTSRYKNNNHNQHHVSDVECDVDALKVSGVSARKVSKHTVLVKWCLPTDLTNVRGYELLIDGKRVEQILSPTACMAVVTCVPNAELLVVSVRTLATSPRTPRAPSTLTSTLLYTHNTHDTRTYKH